MTLTCYGAGGLGFLRGATGGLGEQDRAVQSGTPRWRDNNFGLLRLALASLVILAHSPELIDGNKSRELLTHLFGTLSFGGLGVYGFFIISGYLITQSWVSNPSPREFVIKRLARIVPGYVASFVVCVAVIAPLVGARWAPFRPYEVLRLASEMFRLIAPDVPGVFPGQAAPTLNGSMWTIAYEMRCYGLALLAGLIGLYGHRSRALYLLFVAALCIVVGLGLPDRIPRFASNVVGDPAQTCKLVLMFGAGAAFYLYREFIPLRNAGALICVPVIALGLTSARLAEPALAVFGSYLIFAVAFVAPSSRLSAAANRADVSYGVYLYAFPIQNTLIYAFGVRDPWVLSALTLPLAFVAGFLSWTFVESPALKRLKRWAKPVRFAHAEPSSVGRVTVA